jgi:MFS family permease
MFNLKQSQQQQPGPKYKWVALSNTTVGVFMATLNGSSLMIALPAVFRGIKLEPLAASSSTYLLWLLMGYGLVMAVLVVMMGRIGDMFGRVRMYNLGFLIFSAGSILLSLTWSTGPAGAIELIIFRVVQAVGGAFLFANSTAILTDAFPANQRGLALGINIIAALAGSFIGIVAGGLLVEVGWRWVFLISVPVGVIGTIWAYIALREIGIHKASKIDWWGNLTFAVGLAMVLVGIIYGIETYGTSSMAWTSPFVLGMLIGGVAVLLLFVLVEQRVEAPMFQLSLFRIRAFTAGNIAGLLSAIGRGGLMFMLIIWLQGIWLPLHGYNFEDTPLWAGIYMLPLTAGFLIVAPISGYLSDRFGARLFATGGMIIVAISFVLLMFLPIDFAYLPFALVLFLNGVGAGLFASPNTAAIMNSVPAKNRGAASGMRAAFMNIGSPLSTGVFFSLMIVGLNSTVPQAMYNSLTQSGVSSSVAGELAKLPPVGYLFSALLGYNPMRTLLGPTVLNSLPSDAAANLTSNSYFPKLISAPFHHGLFVVFTFSVVVCLIAAAASWVRGGKFVYEESEDEGKVQ